ncbi:FAD-dependent oxidoreductase [Gracilibacillus alcaliphilus]|uniref:FAD-dependent oxidoreductase n=1 Tax=Gracilibacillus alcaliphilus TaxID=1401441 RepID=UPI0019595505|nr:FAD-dependent oxidoreductase [Gracilibacillus alcaliphilus]MBM7675769.1 ferredoxin-NADP reductase [Gracilibacillus alcaliphilus]
MAFFQDMVSIFKKRDLPFIERVQEAEGVYTFRFEKPQEVAWKAGQHGLFTITHQKIKDHTRPFTIASAPVENVVQMTMKISNHPSEFKKAMLSLQKGDTIKLAGPVGSFYLQTDSPVVLVAGGIGITPFRSILKQIEIEAKGAHPPIHLMYLDSNKSYLFQDELDQLACKTAVQVTYLHERNHLNKELDKLISSSTDSQFFVAGPKDMVGAVTAYLQKQQVPKRNIKKDVLIGY